MKKSGQEGQAMLEYVLVFAILLGCIAALGYLVRAARAASDRTSTFVSAEYP